LIKIIWALFDNAKNIVYNFIEISEQSRLEIVNDNRELLVEMKSIIKTKKRMVKATVSNCFLLLHFADGITNQTNGGVWQNQ